MPRVIFIYPCLGRKPGEPFVRSWQMEPLAIAQLSALTPPSWSRIFYDDRMEQISYDGEADLCAISIETYSAMRGYQIAKKMRARGIPVIFGGYHATARPEEALQHGDAVCVGEAEGVWQQILSDAQAGKMQGVYQAPRNDGFPQIMPDRAIFTGKNYMPISLVETGRGCPYRCDFCSITAFHHATYRRRNADAVVQELKSLKAKYVFFVDDNITADRNGLRELCEKIEPLKIKWISQASIDAANDEELPYLLAKSGCSGLLVGFESLDVERLKTMHKGSNRVEKYASATSRFSKAGIPIYATFVFGYPGDGKEAIASALKFALERRFFLAAFNHLVPFPGTRLYDEVAANGKLSRADWWLDPNFRFGQTPLLTSPLTPAELSAECVRARRSYYSLKNSVKRYFNFPANSGGAKKSAMYWYLNRLLRKEVDEKFGVPLGVAETDEV